MLCSLSQPCVRTALTCIVLQLSKEDEEAVGEETEVRREDQDKINKFSRLHQRELKYEEELKVKNVRHTTTRIHFAIGLCWTGLTDRLASQKEKEELDDITMELELADEDDKIPSVPPPTSGSNSTLFITPLTPNVSTDTGLATHSFTLLSRRPKRCWQRPLPNTRRKYHSWRTN